MRGGRPLEGMGLPDLSAGSSSGYGWCDFVDAVGATSLFNLFVFTLDRCEGCVFTGLSTAWPFCVAIEVGAISMFKLLTLALDRCAGCVFTGLSTFWPFSKLWDLHGARGGNLSATWLFVASSFRGLLI
jgi:hypothetical protein